MKTTNLSQSMNCCCEGNGWRECNSWVISWMTVSCCWCVVSCGNGSGKSDVSGRNWTTWKSARYPWLGLGYSRPPRGWFVVACVLVDGRVGLGGVVLRSRLPGCEGVWSGSVRLPCGIVPGSICKGGLEGQFWTLHTYSEWGTMPNWLPIWVVFAIPWPVERTRGPTGLGEGCVPTW